MDKPQVRFSAAIFVLIAAGTAWANMPERPSCAMMFPGPPLAEGYHGWYLEGEHKLDVPVSWSVWRTYRELASYGWCKYQITPPSAHSAKPIAVGDPFGEFRVTSTYGPRPAPCPGCSSAHKGIDLNTPLGVPLFAPDQVQVTCKEDSGGGGIVAEFDYQGMTHQFLHLGDCYGGSKSYGDVFAITGASGRGTGPHLDYRVKHGGQRVYPPAEVLNFVVNPGDFANF